MKIDQDMLNRYATGQCSAAEQLLVEEWLDTNSWDSLADDDAAPVDASIGDAMWKEVDVVEPRVRRIPKLTIAIAASLVCVLGFCFLQFKKDTYTAHTFTNVSLGQAKMFEEALYDVLLSSNSNASIDLINNTFSFSGDFIFKPKKDMELVLGNTVFVFKEGREYFVSDSPDFGESVAFQKTDLAFLPANMQMKIREQFQEI